MIRILHDLFLDLGLHRLRLRHWLGFWWLRSLLFLVAAVAESVLDLLHDLIGLLVKRFRSRWLGSSLSATLDNILNLTNRTANESLYA